MNKRGQDAQLFMFIEITIGILVAALFVSMAVNYDSFSNVHKIYIENDLKLLSETLLASPREIEYNYPIKSYYDVSISSTAIKITNNAQLLQLPDEDTLTFTKKTNNLEVTKS